MGHCPEAAEGGTEKRKPLKSKKEDSKGGGFFCQKRAREGAFAYLQLVLLHGVLESSQEIPILLL